jgi:hypothetical protein
MGRTAGEGALETGGLKTWQRMRPAGDGTATSDTRTSG